MLLSSTHPKNEGGLVFGAGRAGTFHCALSQKTLLSRLTDTVQDAG